MDDATSQRLEEMEDQQRTSKPSCGSASLAVKPTRSLRNGAHRNRQKLGQAGMVMGPQFKNCHMRLDRMAARAYEAQNGQALDGLPRQRLANFATVLTQPHTCRNNMVRGLHPKFERLNPHPVLSPAGGRDPMSQSSTDRSLFSDDIKKGT